MDILIQAVQFFASLSLLVLIHEFGHYIAARIFKIRVDAFYIFFNPWFSLYKRKVGDTVYGIGWLPLGGYVSLCGMIDETTDKERIEQLKEEPKPWEFRSKPAWQRLIVMLAGVAMNVLLAMIIYTGVLYTWGESYVHGDDVRYGYMFGDEARELGFENGDRITSVNGQAVESINELTLQLIVVGDDVSVEVERDGERRTIDIALADMVALRESGEWSDIYSKVITNPYIIDSVSSDAAREAGLEAGDHIIAMDDRLTPDRRIGDAILLEHSDMELELTVVRRGVDSLGRATCDTLKLPTRISPEGRIGVVLAYEPIVARTKEYTFFESIPAGISYAGEQIASYWEQLKMIVNPETKMYNEVGGFLSIGSVFPDEWNWRSFWNITALISIMLAVMNLLPIPGLDGGHALFTLWEIITRRKPSDKFMVVVQWIGLILLFALLLYANGNDIIRFFF